MLNDNSEDVVGATNEDWAEVEICLVLLGLLLTLCYLAVAQTEAGKSVIASRTAEVEGTKIQYLTYGHGPAVILPHGYTQTSRMWRPIIPLLARKFNVIAPDLPIIAGSILVGGDVDYRQNA